MKTTVYVTVSALLCIG